MTDETNNEGERARGDCEGRVRGEPPASTSAAGDDPKARQREAARQRMRRLRGRRAKGLRGVWRLELSEDAPDVLFRTRYLSAEEARDRRRVEAALADILDFALHQLRRDNRPG